MYDNIARNQKIVIGILVTKMGKSITNNLMTNCLIKREYQITNDRINY